MTPYIVDQFRILTQRVSDAVLETIQENEKAITGKTVSNIKGIWYDHGHKTDLLLKLKENAESSTKKFERFPMIFLLEDTEIIDSPVTGCYGRAKPKVFILNNTEQNYTPAQRYEKNFKPIIDVIADELVNQIDLSGWYHLYDADVLKLSLKRRLYWGKEGVWGSNVANELNDFVDAMEFTPQLDMYFADACVEIESES